MNDQPCIVLTSLGTEDGAEQLAEAIVAARLAACVQVQRVRSFYEWEGKMQREPEWLLVIKTRGLRYAALEAFIRAHHTYQVPEIVQLPISAGSADYLQWLRAGSSGAAADGAA